MSFRLATAMALATAAMLVALPVESAGAMPIGSGAFLSGSVPILKIAPHPRLVTIVTSSSGTTP